MEKAIDLLEEHIKRFWGLTAYQDIVSWSLENIDFSDDVGAERKRLDFEKSSYQIEPLKAWEHDNLNRVVQVIGIEQHGKTLLEIIGVLYSLVFYPGNFLIAYPSDDLAEDINKSKYEPLISKIPSLAADLEKPKAKRSDRYIFGNSVVFFQGAGRKIIAKSCATTVADELAAWQPPPNVDNFELLKYRSRTYSQSICYSVTTPTVDTDKSWRNFLEGSRGYWTLRCRHCDQLTIRSCDLHHLQFESTFDEAERMYTPVAGTCRLICPVCKHEHTEDEKAWMNANGSYVHEFPERRTLKPSFQFGALCSQLTTFSWQNIAEKILKSGKSADFVEQKDFDNSWRGLPFRARKVDGDKVDKLKKKFIEKEVEVDDIECLFVVSDTQDTFSPTALFAVDTSNNIHLLKYEELEYMYFETEADRAKINEIRKQNNLPPVETVEDWLNLDYKGLKPVLSVVDKMGHRTKEVEDFCKRNLKKVVMYSGAGLRNESYKKSEKPFTFLVNSRHYQAELLYYLYGQQVTDQNNFFIYPHIKEQFLKEIAAIEADATKRNGHSYENWEVARQQKHDCFDVCKMAMFARQFLFEKFPLTSFRKCKNKSLLKAKNIKDGDVEAKTVEAKKPIFNTSQRRGWF